MGETEIDKLTAGPLERFCTNTITDPGVLREELAAIRGRGWASSYEEPNLGVWGIAVPALSGSDAACAVSIAGPSARLTVERVRRDIRLVHEAATTIARALGLTAPPVRTASEQESR